ncbi:hypothetical protein HKCCE2091_13800 [Rhodobacterales bacterium HKCCE2091]|nr:hypothetical protein [Rhodobacterales bacterium HKCCE2091]
MGRRRSSSAEPRLSLACLAVAVLAGAAAPAQTFDEAVRTNVTVAIDVCLTHMLDRRIPAEVFPPAGFTHRVIDNQAAFGGGASGFSHFYDAPNDTAQVRVIDPERFSGSCGVTTDHLGIAETAALVDSVVAYRSPDAERHTLGNSSAPMCQGWVITTGGAPISVRMSHPDNSTRGCVEDGTARVVMEIPG